MSTPATEPVARDLFFGAQSTERLSPFTRFADALARRLGAASNTPRGAVDRMVDTLSARWALPDHLERGLDVVDPEALEAWARSYAQRAGYEDLEFGDSHAFVVPVDPVEQPTGLSAAQISGAAPARRRRAAAAASVDRALRPKTPSRAAERTPAASPDAPTVARTAPIERWRASGDAALTQYPAAMGRAGQVSAALLKFSDARVVAARDARGPQQVVLDRGPGGERSDVVQLAASRATPGLAAQALATEAQARATRFLAPATRVALNARGAKNHGTPALLRAPLSSAPAGAPVSAPASDPASPVTSARATGTSAARAAAAASGAENPALTPVAGRAAIGSAGTFLMRAARELALAEALAARFEDARRDGPPAPGYEAFTFDADRVFVEPSAAQAAGQASPDSETAPQRAPRARAPKLSTPRGPQLNAPLAAASLFSTDASTLRALVASPRAPAASPPDAVSAGVERARLAPAARTRPSVESTTLSAARAPAAAERARATRATSPASVSRGPLEIFTFHAETDRAAALDRFVAMLRGPDLLAALDAGTRTVGPSNAPNVVEALEARAAPLTRGAQGAAAFAEAAARREGSSVAAADPVLAALAARGDAPRPALPGDMALADRALVAPLAERDHAPASAAEAGDGRITAAGARAGASRGALPPVRPAAGFARAARIASGALAVPPVSPRSAAAAPQGGRPWAQAAGARVVAPSMSAHATLAEASPARGERPARGVSSALPTLSPSEMRGLTQWLRGADATFGAAQHLGFTLHVVERAGGGAITAYYQAGPAVTEASRVAEAGRVAAAVSDLAAQVAARTGLTMDAATALVARWDAPARPHALAESLDALATLVRPQPTHGEAPAESLAASGTSRAAARADAALDARSASRGTERTAAWVARAAGLSAAHTLRASRGRAAQTSRLAGEAMPVFLSGLAGGEARVAQALGAGVAARPIGDANVSRAVVAFERAEARSGGSSRASSAARTGSASTSTYADNTAPPTFYSPGASAMPSGGGPAERGGASVVSLDAARARAAGGARSGGGDGVLVSPAALNGRLFGDRGPSVTLRTSSGRPTSGGASGGGADGRVLVETAAARRAAESALRSTPGERPAQRAETGEEARHRLGSDQIDENLSPEEVEKIADEVITQLKRSLELDATRIGEDEWD